jgi:murein L,D-transpeptidase YcbB/YkuD
MSLCNQETLYKNVKKSRDSKLMTRLLISYAKNLANGCIDLKAFQASQKAKKARGVGTHYEIYLQKVTTENVKMKLKAGESIEKILAPYVPKAGQFTKLLDVYKRLKQADNPKMSSVLKKVRINIERAKLMKHDFGIDHVLVNVPEFIVRVIEEGNVSLQFPVVVGQVKMQTPIFSAPLQYVTLNPQWGVPDSIARNEIIPKMLRNPGILKKKNMVIRTSYDLNSPEVAIEDVNWSAYPKGEKGFIPYKFIEVPSKRNGLGRVKFIFPNIHAVYMHDTQSKHLFKRKVRTYSHGCIRLAKPVAMLNHVSKYYTNKDVKDVKKEYDSLKTKHISLKKSLIVHTAYYTAYVDETGELKTFPDVYGFDKSQKLTF